MHRFFGRVFCGYLCSFGAMQELAAFISGKLLPGDRKIPERLDGILKYVKYAVLLMIVLCFWILQLPADMSFSPWGVFGIMTSGNLSAVTAAIPTMGTLLLLIILIGAFLVERSFCRYFCPLGAVLSLVSKGRLYRVRRRENECTGCMRCSRKCAMGIDIHDREEVRIGECISCMRCVGSCAPEALRADPGPAVAGTASALVLCGMISLGSSATVGAAASEQPGSGGDPGFV